MNAAHYFTLALACLGLSGCLAEATNWTAAPERIGEDAAPADADTAQDPGADAAPADADAAQVPGADALGRITTWTTALEGVVEDAAPADADTAQDAGAGAPGCTASPCAPPLTTCDGGCVDTRVDRSNCGACGLACEPGFMCDGSGECRLECQTTLAACDGTCVDLSRDVLHCGACGVTCGVEEVCRGAACHLPILGFLSISPSHAYFPGGLPVELEGLGFDATTTVKIGTRACLELELLSSTRLRCVVPAHAPGLADILIQNQRGERAYITASFLYEGFTRVDTIAGSGLLGGDDGPGDVATFSTAINDFTLHGDTLYVADGTNYSLRVVDLSALAPAPFVAADTTVSTLAGDGVKGTVDSTDGTGSTASFQQIDGLSAVVGSWLYLSDTDWVEYPYFGSRLRRTHLETGATETIATGADGFSSVIWDGDNFLYISECGCHDNDIKRWDLTTNTLTNFAGRMGAFGDMDGDYDTALFDCPYGLAFDAPHRYLYVSDWKNQKIRRVDMSTRQVTTFAGSGAAGHEDGVGQAASFNFPNKLVASGHYLFVADMHNCAIRQVDLETTAVTTLAGHPDDCASMADGPVGSATFGPVTALAYDPRFGLFVGSTDWGWVDMPTSHRIRLLH